MNNEGGGLPAALTVRFLLDLETDYKFVILITPP